LRSIHQLFNLSLVNKNDLKYLHEAQIAHQCLVSQLGIFLEFRHFEQKKLGNLSFEILHRPNLLLESKSKTRQDLFALISNQLKQRRTFLAVESYFGVTSSNMFFLKGT
jgi:hypothetical protein